MQALLAIVGGRADNEDEIDDVTVTDAAENTKVVIDSAKLAKKTEKTDSATAEPEPQENEDKTEKDEEKMALIEPRRVPVVDIPGHLQSNPLLRILRKQVVALIKDMDNTKDDTVTNRAKVPNQGRRGGKNWRKTIA